MMKKKILTSTLALLLAGFTVFMSCSDLGSVITDDDYGYVISGPIMPEESQELPNPIEVQALSELERTILHYELLIQTENTAENHFRLAALYREAGMIRMQRDALERSYRLSQDAETFSLLQGVVVNIYEENSLLQGKVRNLRDFLNAEYAQSSAIELVTSQEWFAIMMPNLSVGKRNYYLEDETDGSTLYIEVGFDTLNENKPYTRAWYKTPINDNVVYLFQSGNMFGLLETTVINGSFDGEFSLWLCVVNNDTIFHDTGTFNQGIIVGDFVSRVFSSSESTNLITIFNNRNNVEFDTFIGNFNENGATTLAQPRGMADSQIAYALSEDGRRFIYYTISEYEEREGFVFNYAFLGLIMQPDFEPYTPLPAQTLNGSITLDLSEVQIRIFDSFIQWFDGENWHIVGGVMELLAQDPFKSLLVTTANTTDNLGVAITFGNGGIASPWFNRGGVSEVDSPQTVSTAVRNNAGGATTYNAPAGSNDTSGNDNSGGNHTSAPPPATPQPPPLPQDGSESRINWSNTLA